MISESTFLSADYIDEQQLTSLEESMTELRLQVQSFMNENRAFMAERRSLMKEHLQKQQQQEDTWEELREMNKRLRALLARRGLENGSNTHYKEKLDVDALKVGYETRIDPIVQLTISSNPCETQGLHSGDSSFDKPKLLPYISVLDSSASVDPDYLLGFTTDGVTTKLPFERSEEDIIVLEGNEDQVFEKIPQKDVVDVPSQVTEYSKVPNASLSYAAHMFNKLPHRNEIGLLLDFESTVIKKMIVQADSCENKAMVGIYVCDWSDWVDTGQKKKPCSLGLVSSQYLSTTRKFLLQVETPVGTYLQAVVTLKAFGDGLFYKCDAFSHFIKWKNGSVGFIFVDADKTIIFDKHENLPIGSNEEDMKTPEIGTSAVKNTISELAATQSPDSNNSKSTKPATGFILEKSSYTLGVLLIIFEPRPGAPIQIFSQVAILGMVSY